MSRTARNTDYIRQYNRNMILRLLRIKAMSRSELARKMGVTRAATAKIADELLQEGYISVAEGSRVGRSSAPLVLRGECAYAIGVYLNRDGCSVGVVDISGNVLVQTKLQLTGDDKIDTLASSIGQMIQQQKLPHDKIVGIGISAPGPLDGEQGMILNPPKFDLWHNTAVGTVLEEKLGIPVYLENNASSLARFHQGDSAIGDNYLLLLVDSGVGSGVVINGKVLKGAGYFTSELGHTSIAHNGKPCACGNVGCLEAYAAIPNLLEGTPYQQWKEVVDHLPAPEASGLLQREAEYLATGIVTLTNVISIDAVVLAGDILYGSEYLIPVLQACVNRRNMRRDIRPIQIYSGSIGTDIPVQAAADIAFGRFLIV